MGGSAGLSLWAPGAGGCVGGAGGLRAISAAGAVLVPPERRSVTSRFVSTSLRVCDTSVAESRVTFTSEGGGRPRDPQSPEARHPTLLG